MRNRTVLKVFHALPSAANQYRGQIEKGLQGNPTEAGRARVAVRKLLGDAIQLLPAKGGGHLIAHPEFHRAALLAGTVGSVGSGGVLATNSTAVVHFPNIDRRKIRGRKFQAIPAGDTR